MRFVSAARAVDRRVKHSRASQRLVKRVIARVERRRGDQGDPGEFSDRLGDDQRMQPILELTGTVIGCEEREEESERGRRRGGNDKAKKGPTWFGAERSRGLFLFLLRLRLYIWLFPFSSRVFSRSLWYFYDGWYS